MMSMKLWERIPPDSRVVLYFGCGDGSGILKLQQRYPQARIVGVETVPGLGKPAKDNGLELYTDAAAALAELERTGWQADGWILGRSAWQDETLTRRCLRQLLTRLAKDATLIWEVDRDWPQLKEIISELSEAGISVIETLETIKDSEPEGQQLKADRLVLQGCKQAEPAELLTITAILGEPQACARVRLDEPHAFLSTLPRVQYRRHEELADSRIEPNGRLVWIWQRLMFPKERLTYLQQQLLARRALTIQEWDDDPLHWATHFQGSKFLELRCAHAIQTSTPALADHLSQFNPEVRVFPNCITTAPSLRWPVHQLVTVFFGALNRQADWEPILPELNQVLRLLGEKIRLIVVWDRAFFTAVEVKNKMFVPYCEYPRYLELLQKSDIALLPLLPTRFNRLKSDLKFLECAAMGTAALASPTVYADVLKNGETGLLYETADQFSNGLIQLVTDKALRQRLAKNAWQWVRENRLLSLHYRDRLDWYRSLFDRYDELTEALLQRSPELRR